jgi:flagellar assembly protein FliH
MVRRITDKTLNVETVIWPGSRASGAAMGGPFIQARATELVSAKLPAGQVEDSAPASAELQRRIADLERLKQLETAEAHQRGVEDGLRRGREEAASEVKRAFDQIAHALEELAQVKRQLRQQAEQEIVKLSLAVARRILYRELTTDPGSIEGIVHAALQKLEQREASKVRVWPAGVPAVRAALDRNGSRSGLEVVSDPGLATGAILFETSVGELDASVETQLQEIQRGFADRLAIR